MKCPKCENGTLRKIQFKTSENMAFLCDVCDSLWLEDEEITMTTGHTLHSYSQENDREYSIIDRDEKDQEHQALPVGGKHYEIF